MPTLDIDLVRTPVETTISIALDPVQNALTSLFLLVKAEELPGVNEWIVHTVAAMSPEQRHTHRLVVEGLHHAIQPTRRWASFPAHLDHLASQDPFVLRDQILTVYDRFCCTIDSSKGDVSSDPDVVLASLESYLNYLRAGFPAEKLDEELEAEAYELLKNPPAMQEVIVSHLRAMWTEYLEAEWERNLPMLQTCVDAFQKIDFSGQPLLEVAHQVMGQPVPEKWHELLEKDLAQVVFIPSAHLGPYRSMSKEDETLWLLFGARLPEGAQVSSPDLSRVELLVRLSALADDTRLRILHYIKEQGELCSKDIMDQLDLSQSAASRHLKQLSATGYLTERRSNGAKCYSLNEERVSGTLQALSQFLLG